MYIDKTYIEIKEWERQYNKWLMQNGDKPGKHPDPKHDWNINPEKFIIAGDEDEGNSNRDSQLH